MFPLRLVVRSVKVRFLRFIVHTVDLHFLGIRKFAALKELAPPREGEYLVKDHESPAYIVVISAGRL